MISCANRAGDAESKNTLKFYLLNSSCLILKMFSHMFQQKDGFSAQPVAMSSAVQLPEVNCQDKLPNGDCRATDDSSTTVISDVEVHRALDDILRDKENNLDAKIPQMNVSITNKY